MHSAFYAQQVKGTPIQPTDHTPALGAAFALRSDFQPTGDQPKAIEGLVEGLRAGLHHQVLLGATGTGKTFTIANVIQQVQRPTLILAHNKTLAAQLYSEIKEFFPENAVEYFVSYFDYYQPEAYLPRSDTYIEKDSSRNDEIDQLRHAATKALFERRDTIIVASVSCIYGLGAPVDYGATILRVRKAGSTAAMPSCATWLICSINGMTPPSAAPSSAFVETPLRCSLRVKRRFSAWSFSVMK